LATRKYVTEISFHLASQGVMLLHPKDIGLIEQQAPNVVSLADDCHIYVVATRPRLHYLPNSMVSKDGRTTGKMTFRRAGKLYEVDFLMTGVCGDFEYGPYPHNWMAFSHEGGRYGPIPAHLMVQKCEAVSDPSLRDMCVVYVGMSYGDGNRSARDRLKGHSTLQQVLADMNSDSPDDEALLVLVQYAPPFALVSIDGRDKSLSLDEDRDTVGDLKRQSEMIDGKTEIALAEAGLIKYFQPLYNERYKSTFPNSGQLITKQLYEIDFAAFVVEINTEDINVRLFGDRRDAGGHHIASFDLHDPEVRKSFFDIVASSSSRSAEDHSGPLF
jgi:hypothetical protein